MGLVREAVVAMLAHHLQEPLSCGIEVKPQQLPLLVHGVLEVLYRVLSHPHAAHLNPRGPRGPRETRQLVSIAPHKAEAHSLLIRVKVESVGQTHELEPVI